MIISLTLPPRLEDVVGNLLLLHEERTRGLRLLPHGFLELLTEKCLYLLSPESGCYYFTLLNKPAVEKEKNN